MYNIEFDADLEGSFYLIPVVEEIKYNDAIGDQICLCREGNYLEVYDAIDVADEDVRDFVKEHFENPTSVLGFIRRLTQ